MMDEAELSIAGISVSRETFSALKGLEDLVRRWTPAINLISKNSVSDIWSRHIVDSAQIFLAAPTESVRHWVDLGSGAGFPGLVIAIICKEQRPELRVTLVESDLRKATFLRQAARDLSLEVKVLTDRIESLPSLAADVVSARALAPLSDLLGFAYVHLREGGAAIFPKGARFAEEVADARKAWSFDLDTRPSLLADDACILVIRNIHRAHD
jgi:16S rRNA (guanine527-N7)-methyltransferase